MNSETILDAYRACIAHAAPRGGMHPALALALDYAGVSFAELTDCTIEYGGGLYEIRFSTSWVHYHVFADLQFRSIPGFLTEPVIV